MHLVVVVLLLLLLFICCCCFFVFFFGGGSVFLCVLSYSVVHLCSTMVLDLFQNMTSKCNFALPEGVREIKLAFVVTF